MKTPGMRASAAALQIYNVLRGDIVMGNLNPRERLVEADLTERFQHSRAVVREALSMLQQAKLITSVPNKGASVAETSPPAELENIYRVRMELEGLAASWISLPLDGRTIRKLEKIQGEHTKAVAERRLGDVFQLNEEFHALLYSGCGNPSLEELITQMATRGIIGRYSRSMDQDYLAALRDDHLAMMAALKAEDRATLVKLVRLHLARALDWYAEHSEQYSANPADPERWSEPNTHRLGRPEVTKRLVNARK